VRKISSRNWSSHYCINWHFNQPTGVPSLERPLPFGSFARCALSCFEIAEDAMSHRKLAADAALIDPLTMRTLEAGGMSALEG
jgi:hypothetical protein